MRPGEVQQELTKRLQDGYLRDPQVTVLVKEWNSRKVNVLGQVSKPGPVAYFPRMTIVDAIAAAGGFTEMAAKNSVSSAPRAGRQGPDQELSGRRHQRGAGAERGDLARRRAGRRGAAVLNSARPGVPVQGMTAEHA